MHRNYTECTERKTKSISQFRVFCEISVHSVFLLTI
jgi:hypothetical protein